MQYTLIRGEKGKVEVKVDVPRLEFDKTYDQALVALGKEVKVDGFRPGNVPRDVLESKIGTAKILNEAASLLVSAHLAEIFKKEDIVPVTKPKVAVDSLSRDQTFSFTVEVLARPKVKIVGWKKIKVKKIKAKEVTAEDIKKSIGNIYEAWKKQKKSENSDNSDNSDGQNVGSSDEVEEPEAVKKFIYDAQGEKIYLKEEVGKFSNDRKAKVSGGSNVSKDGIDDDFAKAVGANDLAHLKELVRRDLENMVADQAENKLEEELFDKMLEMGEIDVPDILVDDELNRIMMRLNQELERQGKKVEDFLREGNTTMDALRAKWRPQAEKNVKTTLIMDEIGKQEKVQITKEELENAFKGVDESKLSEQQKVDLQQYIAVSLFQAKTLDLVKKTVTATPASTK